MLDNGCVTSKELMEIFFQVSPTISCTLVNCLPKKDESLLKQVLMFLNKSLEGFCDVFFICTLRFIFLLLSGEVAF